MANPLVLLSQKEALALILESLPQFSKHGLGRISKGVSSTLRVKYKRRQSRIYGTLYRAFLPWELERFFAQRMPEPFRLSCLLMAFCGLRVSESVRVRAQDVNLQSNLLFVRSLKTQKADCIPLCPVIREELARAVKRTPTGYLTPGKSGDGHLSPDYIRNTVRKVITRAGLDQTYAVSTEPTGRKERRLHNLSCHSFRHFFITSVYAQCKNQKVAQRLARHTSMATTSIYLHSTPEEMCATVTTAFRKVRGVGLPSPVDVKTRVV